ncbi:Trimethyllysine dioxygenase, mitochondrial [Merluccius polli]|uniref:Trimethyllysine dioxygenase, mitochondrial n=1 Tax=Merluccius polli TaxID=89951 RepID=A0AA47NZJ1_MERPO|nr:Trimethyllysine dioxygenase, mitochondrial [Merluccius polli]
MAGSMLRWFGPVRLSVRRRVSASGLGEKCANFQKRRLATEMRVGDEYLEVRHGGALLRFCYVWLRDSCRSAACYDPRTRQRTADTAAIDLDLRPAGAAVEDGRLVVSPPHRLHPPGPDGHVTSYSLSWLADHSHESRRRTVVQPRVLWTSDVYNAAQVQSGNWEQFMSCEEELRRVMRNYLLYGIAFVDGVPATVAATQAVSERVSLIRETLYGKMWSFTSDQSRGDSAYTTLALDRHTDTTYFHEPCGVQVFHCLKHEGTGGRTLLVDGFHSAEKVLKESPESFELLSRVPIKHENIEDTGTHLEPHGWHRAGAQHEVYMIRYPSALHSYGLGLLSLRYYYYSRRLADEYNNYDRSPIDTAPPNVIKQWYEAHRLLTAELRKPENELWVKLTPGKVVFIDNWRVMHGRDAFTGLRQVCGCYLPRDDVLSTARALGLLA